MTEAKQETVAAPELPAVAQKEDSEDQAAQLYEQAVKEGIDPNNLEEIQNYILARQKAGSEGELAAPASAPAIAESPIAAA